MQENGHNQRAVQTGWLCVSSSTDKQERVSKDIVCGSALQCVLSGSARSIACDGHVTAGVSLTVSLPGSLQQACPASVAFQVRSDACSIRLAGACLL